MVVVVVVVVAIAVVVVVVVQPALNLKSLKQNEIHGVGSSHGTTRQMHTKSPSVIAKELQHT